MNLMLGPSPSLSQLSLGSTPTQHAARILEAVSAEDAEVAARYPVASWRRCLQDFKLDPSGRRDVGSYAGNRVLNDARDAMGDWLALASDELQSLHSAVRATGYSVGFSNSDGLLILERSDRQPDPDIPTDRSGWMWPENIGGTNAVGTCIIEEQPVSVFGGQHFLHGCTDMACAGAPVFDPGGQLCGVMIATCRDSRLQFQTHRLAADVVKQSAQRLSTAIFHRDFPVSTLIEWQDDEGSRCLIAIDADHHIEGANRSARRCLDMGETGPLSKPLWSVFEKSAQLRNLKGRGGDIELRALRGGKITHARVNPARQKASPSFSGFSAVAHSRPVPQASTVMGLEACAGTDPAMLRNVGILKTIRESGLPILLLGETGTGKDTLARAIHMAGPRADHPFVPVNCAAIPESLIDSELFGYAPGSFTGASPNGNGGRIIEANGGTLFLDEIGDMPLALQTRLLRVLDTQEVVALGTGTPRKLDINVIAATHQDLHRRVAEGQFRQDLFYRLAGAVIDVPPLRHRTDLETIVERILSGLAGGSRRLDASAIDALMRHAWPGNIRELGHVLRRAASLAAGAVITADHLLLLPSNEGSVQTGSTASTPVRGYGATVRQTVSDAEAGSIVTALDRNDGDVEAAARMIGISRATFYRKMQRYNVQRM